MRLAMLLEDQMNPVPESIKVLADWGPVCVINSGNLRTTVGTHVYLEGEQSDFTEWLRPYDGFWRQVPGTSPIMQEFEIVHVMEDEP